ncbi:transcription factor FER-LIKE IRON DEFICIENCY-INDUCED TRANSCRIPTION FACTOR-like [Rutidosis leptorrhynchoides]|uniref:transcription factor FER-LIKE IRON DEFICIENCY-INDUCED TRANSCRIPTION FACTOR-like n=1 Tax=Rutidosis leptorrhynchoides TaxID=125765 RepID=UPI003A990BC5
MDNKEYSTSHFNGGNFNMFQPDFMQETEFENFISNIQAETTDPIEKFCINYECNHLTDSCVELELPPIPYNHNEPIVSSCGGTNIGDYEVIMEPNLDMIWNDEEEDVKVSEVFGDDDDDSSETVTTGNQETTSRRKSGSGVKGDRTRTLISERKRRSGMKEKLYALRSLVPNITKMDKASIVGDAARYIQDLQTQAKNLRNEIATIEAATNQNIPSQNLRKNRISNSFTIHKKISKLDIFQVEEKGYYVRLVCNKGRGIAVSLHKALESITSFQVQTSNLATIGDNFVLTFTLNVTVCEFDINLPNLKLWLSGAFLNQGFVFDTLSSA